MTGSLDIHPVHPMDPDALAMIGQSEEEQAAIYPPKVRFAFSPEELVDAAVLFLVARHDGEPVGCGGVAFIGDGAGAYAELKRVFTTRAVRGRGIASAIVRALEGAAAERGIVCIRLETGEASPEALALYGKLGYARRSPFGTYSENGSSVFMEKRLV